VQAQPPNTCTNSSTTRIPAKKPWLREAGTPAGGLPNNTLFWSHNKWVGLWPSWLSLTSNSCSLLFLLSCSLCHCPAGLTGDLLVLIEPGTPAGFANILEARSGILQYEGRRTDKLQRRLAAASSNGSGSSSSSSQCSDPNLPAKVGSKWFGAHVVAPCPHDAPCPLAAPGSTSWCHFGTRFHRPGFMQQAKAPTGSRMNPSDHQDERYSYVVLR